MKSRSDGDRPVLMVTNTPDGPAYGLDTGKAISQAKAREIQADLCVKPNDDGLFPNCPQTWRRGD
jgi:hypothetical protein